VNYLERKEAAQEVVETLQARGAEAVAVAADVRSAAQVRAMVETALSRWHRLDLLIHNAGTTRDALLLKMTEEAWDDVVGTHLSGAFHCLSASAVAMKAQGGGHVILIGSLAGLEGRAGQANYAAAKSGLVGLTRTAARELGRFNVRVNLVLPGYHETGMTRKLSETARKRLTGPNLLGRSPDMGEVADFIEWLSQTRNISGQLFNLDNRIA
jgi:3-oxoacyl-[acyl-carrier protein] reductase